MQRVFLLGWLLWLFSNYLEAQQTVMHFSGDNLVETIERIEQQTQWVFNYDPEALAPYVFAGRLDLEQKKAALEQLFFRTPFQYEVIDQTIVVFRPDRKPVQICGSVRDQLSNNPLPFANVYVADYQEGSQSDGAGRYAFEFTADLDQMIYVSYVGYQTDSMSVRQWIQKGCQDLKLKLDKTLFKEAILVKDYLLDGVSEGEAYGAINMDYQQISNHQSNIEQDLLKTVQLIPGINSVDESAVNLRIRGGSPDQNLVLWEGTQLYDPGHFFGMISSINPFVIEEVKVYKGVFEPRYGNATGGVVDMSLSDSIVSNLKGGVGTTFSEAHAYLKIPVWKNKLSLMASGRHSLQGVLNSPTLNSFAVKVFQGSKLSEEDLDIEAEETIRFYDWNAKLIFRPHRDLLIKASYFESNNDFNYSAESIGDIYKSTDDQLNASEAYNVLIRYQLNSKWQSSLSFSESSYKSDYLFNISRIRLSESLLRISSFNSILDKTIIWSNQINVNPYTNIGFGLDHNQKSVQFNFGESPAFEPEYEDVNFAQGHFSNAFLSFDFAKKNIQLNGGIRATAYREPNTIDFSPRINFQYAVNEHLKYKVSAGLLHQFIGQLAEFGYNDLNLNNPVWILNDVEIEDNIAQTANKAMGGFLFRKNGWLLDMELYYHKNLGLTTYSPIFGSETKNAEFSVGESDTWGVDVLLKKHWKAYNLWVNYAWNNARFFFPTVSPTAFPASRNQRHVLSILNHWNWNKFNCSLTYQFKSGLPFSETDGIQHFANEDEPFYEIRYGLINQDFLKNYQRVDLGISFRDQFLDTGSQFEVAFSIINLLGRENVAERDNYLDNEEEDDFPFIVTVDRLLLERTLQLLIRWHW